MRIYSWNVNGIRACVRKGFASWLDGCDGDIIGLQEVRARDEQIPAEIARAEGWLQSYVSAEKAGYSGVGLISREAPSLLETELGVEAFDKEGRVQIAHFGQLVVANVYFPNGSGKNRDNSRVPFKLDFYARLKKRLDTLRDEGKHVVVIGDFNTAHDDIDLARPKANRKTSGFLEEERAALGLWLDDGWIDSFRHLHPEAGEYSWWSNRPGVRERNVGWRIDYALLSPSALPLLRGARIHGDVMGSDHCPVSVELEDAVWTG